MRTVVAVVLVCVAALLSGMGASADPEGCAKCGMRGGGPDAGGMMGGMAGAGIGPTHRAFLEQVEHLSLEQDQRAAINEIRSRTRKDLIKKRSDLQVAMVELQELLVKDTVDLKTVEAKLKQIEGQRTAMQLGAIREELEVRAKLTAEQNRQVRAALVAGRGNEHQCRDHKGPGQMHH